MTLYRLIVKSSRSGMELQNPKTGAMPAGHNGPYHDPETPVRNTGHWALLFLKAYEITREETFREATERAIGYLCSPNARPVGATFYHRMNPLKDTCNGLIGQAWSIEALVEAGEVLERKEWIQIAQDVFLLHPFNEDEGVWQRVSTDGMHLPVDETFNHQLWFAAAGAMLSKRSEAIGRQVERFMQMLPVNMRLYRSGLIVHPLLLRSNWQRKLQEWKRALRPASRRALQVKAVGYHLFNLYAFSMLHRQFPDHTFWKNPDFRRALHFSTSESFQKELLVNPYGFPYNPPGFEMAMTMQEFGTGNPEEQQRWVVEQIKRCYNEESGLMDLNSEDPHTQAARLYEATRISDMELS